MSDGGLGVGEAAALASAVVWAGASLVFARVGARVPALTMNLVKTGLAFVGLVFTLWLAQGSIWPAIEGRALMWVGLSGVIGLTIGDSLFFLGLARLGPKRSLVLWALTPATTALLASSLLDEPINAQFFTGLVTTSLGVGLVLRARAPEGQRAHVWDRRAMVGLLFGLGAVLCQALGSVTAKMGGAGLSGLELSVVRLAFGTAVLVPLGWIEQRRSAGLPNRPDLLRIGFGTFIGTYLGIWLSMIALQAAFAGVVATLQAMSPVFVLPLARIVDKERIGPMAVLGASIAVLGVAVLTLG